DHRGRALSPDRPTLRGTAHNPDTYFQAREAANPFYDACPDAVRAAMARFAELTGRRYDLFDYAGHPEAERVIAVMGWGGDAVRCGPAARIEPDDVVRPVVSGLGSAGTVGSNKNTINTSGHETPLHVQGHFDYDARKSGAVPVSHLPVGPRPIRSTYLVDGAH